MDLWVPLGLPATQFTEQNRFNEGFAAFARLKPDVRFTDARTFVQVLSDRVKNNGTRGGAYANDSAWGMFIVPITDFVAGDTKTPMLVLLGAVGFVLLIASQVHHMVVFVEYGTPPRRARAGDQFSDVLIGYVPGVPTVTWDPDTAYLIKAGSMLLFQVHYVVNGKEAIDRSVLGLKIRKDKPAYRGFSGSAIQFRLEIPPNDPSYQAKGTYTFKEDVTLLDMTPHMHLRGKAFKYVITYPDGRTEELLKVPRYEFNWQLSYIFARPRQVPAGSMIEATAWYDNSANNKYNPDPTQTVRWGDQTFQEMLIGFFNYKVRADRPEPVP